MRVKIYDIDNAGNETLRTTCNLHDCFPDDSRNVNGTSEFLVALEKLKCDGRYWTGGGASPLTLIMKAE